ncbi:MAG: hypothetical protein KatS3mg068_2441 [Candidatus Sericytochromatia bacterium]|nr:MAG: hypothetical protein KatS3mg068_2441 [Candidatus Sericytochromatia bacterium]
MKKILSAVIIILFFINNAYAQQNKFYFDDKTELTPYEIKIWKYKMSKLSIRYEYGKWDIIQGVNTPLTDMQLLKLVNSEEIGYQRLKNLEAKRNIGDIISISGLIITLGGAFLLTNILKFENSNIYGIAGIGGGFTLLLIGNSLNPIIQDESEHILTMEEAKFSVEIYNKHLRESLGLKEADVE